jgi:anti-sigma factor RsiW
MKTSGTQLWRQTGAARREAGRHLRLRGLIEPYVDGELTTPQRRTVAAHIARCWTCSTEAETLTLIKHSLRTGPLRAPASLSHHRLRRFALRLSREAPD